MSIIAASNRARRRYDPGMAYRYEVSLAFLIGALIAGCANEDPPPAFEPGPGALGATYLLFTGSEFVAVDGLDLLRSSDGVAWTREPVPEGAPRRLFATDGAGTVIGVDFPTEERTDLYLSTDARNWELVAEIDARVGQISYGNGIWLGYAVPTRTLFRSTDGRTWMATELEHPAPTSLEFAAGRFYMYSGTGSVRFSEDGQSWTEQTLPLDSDTLVLALVDVHGAVNLTAAKFAPGPDGGRTNAYRLRELDGQWTREEIELEDLVSGQVQAGEEIIGHVVGEGRIRALIDAESWRWETVLASPSGFLELVAGDQAVIAVGHPMAVSLDRGVTWTGAELAE